ncbi:hypothetical protein TIFTF001_044882 [Ficus carica]|uniref:Uncharacterized protein n=1 Tax=Ficus carica TaxID=3494 RepID=A0AA87ZC50_FICCA|nr:hypothetical protein TIFTF001_044882 [Ficus carica]
MIGIETKEIRFEIERIRLYGSEIRSHAVSFRQGRRKASAAAAASSVGGGKMGRGGVGVTILGKVRE